MEALITNEAPIGSHVIIDPFQTSEFHQAGLVSVQKLGLEAMIEFREEFSEFALPTIVEAGRNFDFIFIDGDHRFDGVFLDLVFGNRLLKPEGVMVFDDSWADSVFLACRFLEKNYHYAPIAEYPALGRPRRSRRLYRGLMRAYRKPAHPLARNRFHFVPFHEGLGFGDRRERELRVEGVRALEAGNRIAARKAFVTALRLNPRRAKTYLRLLRTYLPGLKTLRQP